MPRRAAPASRVRLLALLTLAIAAAATARPARADETGGLHGIVTDMHGAPLAGVTVAVSQPGAGVPKRGAVTGPDGNFRIAGLPASGGYTLRFTLDGYATVVVSAAEVRSREITRIDAVLTPAKSLRETVQVKATPSIVALDDTTTRTRFSSEFIDNLPILGRNYQDVLTLAPGVTDVDGDGNPNIHGARDTDVVTLVDGLSTTDPLTGKIGAQMNLESIQEVEVKSSGASAEYGRAQGGFTSLLTKSGGNDFEGMFKFFWRGSALDGDGAGIDDPSLHGGIGEQGLRDLSFDDYLPFLSLSGPIARDKAWFYVALEYIQREEPVNALNSAFVTGLKEYRAFAKATWQVKPNLRLALSVNRDPQDFLNQGLNSRTREETGYTRSEGGTNIALRSVGILGPNVVLEGALGWFDSRPGTEANLGLDNNNNGILYDDRNHDGFLAPTERDAGEDFDGDGAFDVWEDTIVPNGFVDGREVPIDPDNPMAGTIFVTEDVDHSGDLTGPGECEGRFREDLDCDGHLDVVEDANHNGRLDPDEDIDKDHRLDLVAEDRNGDGKLNDTPFPKNTYPYGELRPTAEDRDYFIDESTGIVSGPFYETWDDTRRRDTVKADLGVFVPDFHGSHDLRTGVVLEREAFHRGLDRNDIVAFQPEIDAECPEGGTGVCIGGRPESYVTLLPTERSIQAEASGQSGGIYAIDIYKPRPNLSFGLGVRYDREVARAPGFEAFDPRLERDQFDRLTTLAGSELLGDDLLTGNRDGIRNMGITDDLLINNVSNPPEERAAYLSILSELKLQALRHLTRHRSTLPFTNATLGSLYPGIFTNGVADPEALSALGLTFQGEQPIAITNDNLAPRLSVSWDPAADGRTKVYATWGRYYDKLFLSTVVGEQGPDLLSRYYQSDPDGLDVQTIDRLAVATPNHHIGPQISQSPPSVRQVDRGLRTPYNDEWTVGFERELAPELALAVRYIHRDFRDQLQDVDINHEALINPGTGLPRDQLGALTRLVLRPAGNVTYLRAADGKPDLYIENYFFNQVLRVGNDNTGRYSAIELELRKRMSRRWEMQGSYVYSRAQGEAEDFQSKAGNDPSTIENEFGYLDFDQRHVVKLSLGMFLPSDWQAGLTTTWSSGLPYSVISRFFALDNAGYTQFRTRYGFTDRVGDAAVFETLPRNSRRNGSVYDLNLSARKNFVIGRNTAALSFEVFNVLNTDDLRIYTYEKDQNVGFDVDGARQVSDALQLDAVRRFGRRFQIGFQFSF
ncbi:MAG TPA: TonB-dependent receptor [Dongiaceae bacterium]|nr:TonB-dependent receptor [Dongiaceae bacterium]